MMTQVSQVTQVTVQMHAPVMAALQALGVAPPPGVVGDMSRMALVLQTPALEATQEAPVTVEVTAEVTAKATRSAMIDPPTACHW